MVKTGNPERYDILIYDMAGSILKQFADMEDGQVDISDLPSGLYFVEFKFSNEMRTEKLIVLSSPLE